MKERRGPPSDERKEANHGGVHCHPTRHGPFLDLIGLSEERQTAAADTVAATFPSLVSLMACWWLEAQKEALRSRERTKAGKNVARHSAAVIVYGALKWFVLATKSKIWPESP